MDGEGAGENGRDYMLTGQHLTIEDCIKAVKETTNKRCLGANGATQHKFGGCYCEFDMEEVINSRDGTKTCLFRGEYKNPTRHIIRILLITFGSLCGCCCLCLFLLCCSSEVGK